MKRSRLSLSSSFGISCAAMLFAHSVVFGTEFYWDGSSSTHWGRPANWNSGGAGGNPDDSSDTAWLVFDGMSGVNGQGVGSGRMTVSVDDNDSSDVSFNLQKLYIATNASDHDWVLSDVGASKLKVYESMVFDLQGNGSATINADIELGDNAVELDGRGNRAVLNGKLIGGSSAVLNADTTFYAPSSGSTQLGGGGLTLTASNNDSFLGTIKVGRQDVEVTTVNGLRKATIDMQGDDSFIYPTGATIGGLIGSGNFTVSRALTVGNNDASNLYTGRLKGSAVLTKAGSGTWTLGSGPAGGEHTGIVYLAEGRIRMQNNGGYNVSLKDSQLHLLVDNGLNMWNGDVNLGALSGSGSLNLESGTLRLDGGFNASHTGAISGSGSIEISTSGSQELGGASSFSGGVDLEAGTLKVSAENNLGLSSSALDMGSSTLQATNTHTQSRTLQIVGSASVANISVDSGKTLTWSGVISDDGGAPTLKKSGSGTLSLTNNANTFDGHLDVDAGVVSLSSTTAQNWFVDIGVNGELSLNESTATVKTLTGAGNVVVSSGKTLKVSTSQDGAYSGNISGAGDVEKLGSNRWTYSGNSTLTGDVTVKSGPFILIGNTGTASIGDVVVESGAAIWGYGRSSGVLTVNGTVAPYSTLRANSITLNGSYNCEVQNSGSDKLQADTVLDVSSGTLQLQFPSGAPSQAVYVLASYGSLTGTFSSVKSLPSGYKIDYAYNGDSIAMVQDNIAPTVTSITPVTASPTSSSSVQFTVVCDEEVTNFDALADVVVTKSGSANYSGGSVTTADGETYTVTLTNVIGDGDLQIAVSTSNGVKDVAQNNLAVSPTSSAVTVDNTAPTVASITPITSSPTNSTSVSYSVVFDEEVVGFDSYADLSLGKTGTATATAAAFSTSDNITYTVTLTDAVGDGELTLSVVTGSNVQDGSGNSLFSSVTSAAVEVDNTRPQITSFTTSETSPSAANSIAYSITFSEPMNGFIDASDIFITAQTEAIVVQNDASVVNAGDDTNYTVTLNTISGDGILDFRPALSEVKDKAGNSLEDNSSIYSPSMIIDNTAPTVASITPITVSPTNDDSVSFSVVFDETVTGFDSFADLSIGKTDTANATGATFLTSDNITYTVTLTGVSGNGDLTLAVVTGSGVQDAVAHDLASSVTSAAVTVDNVAPTVASITPITSSPATGSSVSFSVVFSEAVTGFDSFADLVVGKTDTANATTASFSTADNITFTVELTDVSGDGDLTLGVVTGAGVQDAAAQNLSTSVTSAAVTVDNTAPTVVSITPLTTSPTSTPLVRFEVVFSEEVAGFDALADIVIGKTGTVDVGVVAFFSSDQITYELYLNQVIGDGDLTLSVVAGSGVQDQVNKDLVSSVTSAAVTVDNTAPTVVSITPETASPTNSESVSFTVVFDEEVTGFDSFADLSIGKTNTANATTATFSSGDNITHTVTLTNVSGDGDLTLAVVTGSGVQDAVSQSLATSVISAAVTVDNTAPMITLSGDSIVTLSEGASWADPGASATDDLDGSVSVTKGGDAVDTSALGEYTITYDATDSAGNAAEQKARSVTVATAPIIYVDAFLNGEGGAENGQSWGNAFVTLQDALDSVPTGVVQTIHIAQGAYYPDLRSGSNTNDRDASFVIPSGVKLYGGFAGNGAGGPASARDTSQYLTVLSGDIDGNDTNEDANNILQSSPESNIVGGNSRRVVLCQSGNKTTVLDGLTITAGHADVVGSSNGGAAMKVEGGSAQLTDVHFTGNWNAANNGGAGLQVANGTVTVTSSTLTQNTSTQSNGGFYQSGGEVTFTQSHIESNRASNGAGLGHEGGTLTIDKCYLRGNEASQSGGAIYVWYGNNLIIRDSLISGNRAGQSGGAIQHTNGGSAFYLTNSTVAGNYATSGGCGGIYILNNYSTWMTNSIVSGNGSGFGVPNFELYEGQAYADHSILEGVSFSGGGGSGGTGGSGGSSGGGPSAEIIDVNSSLTSSETFADAQAPNTAPTVLGDYQLVAASAGIDAGNASGAQVQTVSDLLGEQRVVDSDDNGNSLIDMGAFEFQNWSPIRRWRAQYDLDVDGGNDDDVLSDDGMTVRMKYAFNLGDPRVVNRAQLDSANPGNGGLPVLSEIGGVYTYSYIEPVGGLINVRVDASKTLASDSWEYFNNLGDLIIEHTTESIEGGEYQLRQIKVDSSKEERVFFRTEVDEAV